jgi:hypothetical protein
MLSKPLSTEQVITEFLQPLNAGGLEEWDKPLHLAAYAKLANSTGIVLGLVLVKFLARAGIRI